MDCKTRQKYMLSEVDVIDRHTFYNIEYAHAATAVTAVVMQAPRSPVDRYRFCPLQAPSGQEDTSRATDRQSMRPGQHQCAPRAPMRAWPI